LLLWVNRIIWVPELIIGSAYPSSFLTPLTVAPDSTLKPPIDTIILVLSIKMSSPPLSRSGYMTQVDQIRDPSLIQWETWISNTKAEDSCAIPSDGSSQKELSSSSSPQSKGAVLVSALPEIRLFKSSLNFVNRPISFQEVLSA
jgi:hypothetical protein